MSSAAAGQETLPNRLMFNVEFSKFSSQIKKTFRFGWQKTTTDIQVRMTLIEISLGEIEMIVVDISV